MPTTVSVSAFTVGVTSARFEACKRGLAANYAAIVARRETLSVCVIDADPRSCDVGTRLGVTTPSLRRFVAPKLQGATMGLDVRRLSRLTFPPLTVLPAEPSYVDLDYNLAYDAALEAAQAAFELVVVDLPVGAGRPGPTLDGRLVDALDALVLTLTPDRAALAATLRHLELFAEALERGAVDPKVRLVVVMTGDEGSTTLPPEEVAEMLGDGCFGRIPQLWGRALPNLGFGPTVGVPSLDAAVDRLHRHVTAGRLPAPTAATAPPEPAAAAESAGDSRLFGVRAAS
jgi:MinD-like ATPase involved in chromosome partitioning or flagellar assembly